MRAGNQLAARTVRGFLQKSLGIVAERIQRYAPVAQGYSEYTYNDNDGSPLNTVTRYLCFFCSTAGNEKRKTFENLHIFPVMSCRIGNSKTKWVCGLPAHFSLTVDSSIFFLHVGYHKEKF